MEINTYPEIHNTKDRWRSMLDPRVHDTKDRWRSMLDPEIHNTKDRWRSMLDPQIHNIKKLRIQLMRLKNAPLTSGMIFNKLVKIYLLGNKSEEGIESKVSMAVYTG